MTSDYSKEAFDAAFAEESIARAFGRETVPRVVTETDQNVARAFGRPVPELTETAASAWSSPVEEMEALVTEFEELRVSRRGDSRTVARNSAITQRVLMSEYGPGGGRRVTDLDRLGKLREMVESLRAEVPLSASADAASEPEAPTVEEFDSAFGGHRRAPDGRRYTQAEVDESVARAFGRTTKGDQR